MNSFLRRIYRRAAIASMAVLLPGTCFVRLCAQQPRQLSPAEELARIPLPEPAADAFPLPEDRGAASLEQAIQRLGTTASVLFIVAHPDDEDGALLTYLTRGLGARVTLLTLTRGEGGQNAISAASDDALGLIRTNELLQADAYYGVRQLWGTEADFGFSKTQEESFAKWGHDRVLYDAVLAVRKTRPQIILSTFVGGLTDGHGQHQVSGEIAQEAFLAAGDPKVFPDQLKNGLQPWQPLAVYSRTPFAPVTGGKMFDYATGKWAPARFHNDVTGQWTEGALPADVTLPVGSWDAALGQTYVQIARTGWGRQLSQNGGDDPTLSAPVSSSYHLWAVAPAAAAASGSQGDASLFVNRKVHIDTSLTGLAQLAGPRPPAWLTSGLRQMQSGLDAFLRDCPSSSGNQAAERLAPVYREALDLDARVRSSNLSARAKADLAFELDEKIEQFQIAFKDLLGLDLAAFVAGEGGHGFGSENTADLATARSVYPGERFNVRVHTFSATQSAHLRKVWIETASGQPWTTPPTAAAAANTLFALRVPADAQSTAPYFTRPSTEQPFYDLARPAWRERSFAPYPLSAWAEFDFDGLPIRLGMVVQTMQRVAGRGGVEEPLVVTPAVGLRIEPKARILPVDGSALPVRLTVHAERAEDGFVDLKLPAGWRCEPARQTFHLSSAGDTPPLLFSVFPEPHLAVRAYTIEAAAHVGRTTYSTGWQSIGYAGLRPYNQYQPAALRTRKVDVKLAPGLRVGYVMGTGDTVPDALAALGLAPHLLTDAELATGDLAQWNVIVIGIRAYSVRPELTAAEPRLENFVAQGGTLLVQYQSATFPAPLPLAMKGMPERVVDEQAPVKLLDPAHPLLNWPNRITADDFNGWFEERGHGFLDHWDSGYTALTETADPGQDAQRGGLLVAHRGRGTYIYVSYALYRQFPELVPGAYRIFANLLSAGRAPERAP